MARNQRHGRNIWPMTAPLSSPRRRALAAALKQVRIDRQVGQRELARRLDIQHARLSHWESGARLAPIEYVAALLQELRVGPAEKDRILELAKNAHEPNWLSTGTEGLSPGLAGVLDCEQTAQVVTAWAVTTIPGLLQTSDYARAIITAGDTLANRNPADNRVDRILLTRMGRRDILTRANPVTFLALISERAIREVVGSPAIQADQLRHLLKMANQPNVSILVVPSGIGWHPGFAGAFVIYDFADSPSIFVIEHISSSAFGFEERDVAVQQAAAEQIRSLAMSPTVSTGLIASVIQQLDRETTTK
jgi:transcriptional regulator with XRE-family HTH domain